MIAGVRGVVDRWATSADEHASLLYGPEATLRTTAETPEDREAHSRAQGAIAEVETSWISASTSFAGEIDTYRVPLGGASTRTAFNPLFPYPPLEGTEYVTAVSRFAITSMVPLSIIDPSGQTERAAAARLDWLFNTETGRLIFTIIETAHERDIGESDEHWSEDDLLAACDPELVEQHIRDIYEEAGEPLDQATLDLLVDETLAAAWSIRASRNDDWEGRDEDLGFFEHGFGEWLREDFAGPAAAFVATAGCAGAITVATGGLGAPAAGGCAVLGGAVGDSVSTWANGGDLGDIASAAVDPQRRLLDFGVGFATQGVLNRVLPTTAAAPAAPSARGSGAGWCRAGPARSGGRRPDRRRPRRRRRTSLRRGSHRRHPSPVLRTRLDLYVELPNGQRAFLEVKTGPTAAMNSNQAAAFPRDHRPRRNSRRRQRRRRRSHPGHRARSDPGVGRASALAAANAVTITTELFATVAEPLAALGLQEADRGNLHEVDRRRVSRLARLEHRHGALCRDRGSSAARPRRPPPPDRAPRRRAVRSASSTRTSHRRSVRRSAS